MGQLRTEHSTLSTRRRRLYGTVWGVVRDAGRAHETGTERVMSTAQCEICGNEYDKAFGTPHTYAAPTLTIALTL
jgi:hypothetical protein